MSGALLDWRSCREVDLQVNPGVIRPSEVKIFPLRRREIWQSRLPRKFPKLNNARTVPKTDTGSQLE